MPSNGFGGLDPDHVLGSWRDWGLPMTGRPRVVDEVHGGRTNRSVRIDAPGLDHELLLRINHPEPVRLGIDRDREREIVRRTAERGIGRPFLHWDPAHRFAVFPWLDARVWSEGDLTQPDQQDRLRVVLERLHRIDMPHPRRRYADYLQVYWHQLVASGRVDARLEAAWEAFEPRLRAFDSEPWPARLTHHDLVPQNILDCGDRLILIDFEYAAVGHAGIDQWSIDPAGIAEPFISELMEWVNGLWERLIRGSAPGSAPKG